MKPIHIIAPVVASISLGMPSLLQATTNQTSTEQMSEKVSQLAEKDPTGLVLTLTAVLTVFVALLLLVFVFKLLAKVMVMLDRSKEKIEQAKPSTTHLPTQEEQVAIALALESIMHMPEEEVSVAIGLAIHQTTSLIHDEQNYGLPTRRQPTQWNGRLQGMRQYNKTQ